jgi:uncharacterized protein YjbJ (UPF0337 family)
MSGDRIEGNWKQFKGNVKAQWGKFTDDQLDVMADKRDHLADKIHETYGMSKEEAEKQLHNWQKSVEEKSTSINNVLKWAQWLAVAPVQCPPSQQRKEWV